MRRALDGKCSTENVGLESLSANALPSRMPMHACVAVCVRRFRVRPLSEGTSPCKICTAAAVKALSIKIQKKQKFRTPGDGMRRALDGKCSTENVGLESLSANALPPPCPCMPVLLSVSGGFGLGLYRKARGGSMGLWVGRPGPIFFCVFHFCLQSQAKSPTGLTL